MDIENNQHWYLLRTTFHGKHYEYAFNQLGER